MSENNVSQFFLRTITAFVLASLFFFAYFYLSPLFLSFIFLCILIYILLFEWPKLFNKNPYHGFLVAPLYPISPFAVLIFLNHYYHTLILPLVVFTASYDTGAYLVGSLFGKHKIVPTISPRKTWEGLVGGYACVIISCCLYNWFVGKTLLLPQIIGISFAICMLAFFGDLLESWLKRRAGIKDIGAILPGHGGFLDRVDGILFVTVFFYVFRKYLVLIF